MLRTQISLTEAEKQLLDAKAAETGRSVAALIRDAVDAQYGNDPSREQRLAALQVAAGAWGERDYDGAEWVERLRSGRRLRDVL